MADDGVPFYSPIKLMIWCVSKLSLHAMNARHVSFNETMNEYYTYYDRKSQLQQIINTYAMYNYLQTTREHQQKQHIILISSLEWKMSIIIIVQTSNDIVHMFSLVWMISMLMM
ncbi:hypothetical protein O6H91_13G048300 [Diphasiastrum complanatum]|uniref:Uncharacterized protein n=1 Tax=Diphasiastrum complanatum TaxID=34168 RepID=A0ACC2BUK0_DIPCM|nr:hypothetical protein O6H91_13G048300 [Diphasiastrum complanatum]